MAQIAQLSPGVITTETNLTTVVPSVLTTAGAYAGAFNWGPVNTLNSVGSEKVLVNTFNAPDSNTAASFFTAASFLAYGNNLQVVRAANTGTLNSTATGTGYQVQNPGVFQYSLLAGPNGNSYGAFMGRYPGALGNSLTVSVIDAGSNTAQFASWNVAISNTTTSNASTVSLAGYFNGLPSTSSRTAGLGGANDQIHIAVIDTGGLFSGVKGTVLETFPYLSKAVDSVDQYGNSNYYKNAIFQNSKFIYAVDPVNYVSTNGTWGKTAANTSFVTLSGTYTLPLTGGADATITDGDVINAMYQFSDSAQTAVSLIMTGPYTNVAVQSAAVTIASTRKDAVAFLSPPSSTFSFGGGTPGQEVSGITSWITALSSVSGGIQGSYAFADSNWKYMFDRYNNTYRWVPMNGDVAGLCVYTDSNNAPWWSPAGYNRGVIKNVIKLAFNQTQAIRDQLYPLAVNPIASFPGQGTVLFGDKTLQSQPSAFDRINVRRLFIVLEQAIAQAAKFSLFEFNDAFTQAQFIALITPYLTQVQAQRGITAFQVVCDATNNTPSVVNANQFVGDIYIQPARSINFIQLNFVAVGTGVTFSTITNTTA